MKRSLIALVLAWTRKLDIDCTNGKLLFPRRAQLAADVL